MQRWVSGALAILVAVFGLAAVQLGAAPEPAAAADGDPPVVYKIQAFWDRIDGDVDELRGDIVIRVPHGYVDPVTGNLQTVNGQQLRVGHDYNTSSGLKSHRYINTIAGGQAGATSWAQNRDEYFTIHKVIVSGGFDFLVMSIEGDIDITNAPAETNVPGGLESTLNYYFSYASGAPSTATGWISSALTVSPTTFYWYYGNRVSTAITGPQYRIPWDNIQGLWSAGQANWGSVLDYGLNGQPAGVLPPNSVGLDMVNNATRNANPEAGPSGTITESMWYAWVHEDGSLVDAINTAPIRLTGNVSRDSRSSTERYIIKNLAQADRPDAPAMGWTAEQAAQGLTEMVGVDGAIDFREAGGTGYYKLVAWPEARDPLTPNAYNGSPLISYTAADLFDASGQMTALGELEGWDTATVYYGYDIPLPDPPVVTVPPDDSHTNQNGEITISGTGTPGHTISLKLTPGTSITDYNDPALTLILDGEHEGVQPGDVVVDAEGNWTFTYTPSPVLADGQYTVVAVQTDQQPGNFNLTSDPSNPDVPEAPTEWGVTFTVDTVAPDPLTMTCPASPTENQTPTLSGSGAEEGATVQVYEAGELIGEATVTGSDWSYTVDPALGNGSYTFTATQTDRAGNVSELSAPPCELRVAIPMKIEGAKAVTPVVYPAAGIGEVDAENWEITLSDGTETVVMSGGAQAELTRDVAYTVAERLRADPVAQAGADRYLQLGQISCVDADGVPLPASVFDPDAGTITVAADSELPEPLSCIVTNQAAHTSFVTHRIGGQTTAPSAGWTLAGAGDTPGFDLALGDTTAQTIARPGDYQLTGTAPEGLSVLGYEALDLSRTECAALAPNAATAPDDCWVAVAGGAAAVPQGAHQVFRVVAAAPADMPKLPLTGGLGSWVFMLGGGGVLAVAAAGYARRRFLLAAAGSGPAGHDRERGNA
ncbi:Ig-like domain-containing protein [Leucobacter luti]|uniref:Bacterial Ig-like domain-containing protein n=1 Tax=Leucobacter luti TaxID=340320 RepID=A0A4Q7U6D9_9MICO|nr:Ig-like domain-containing protein [Leucobacter luti]MBL3700650.1 hypothetical protein [Leucobacter luti]RZT68510.1 hypothetical protein EV139_0235 [Leucobacter luti]